MYDEARVTHRRSQHGLASSLHYGKKALLVIMHCSYPLILRAHPCIISLYARSAEDCKHALVCGRSRVPWRRHQSCVVARSLAGKQDHHSPQTKRMPFAPRCSLLLNPRVVGAATDEEVLLVIRAENENMLQRTREYSIAPTERNQASASICDLHFLKFAGSGRLNSVGGSRIHDVLQTRFQRVVKARHCSDMLQFI